MPVAPAPTPTAAETAVYRKVTWRLLPFLMLCYTIAYLDRVNVGFAKLQMLGDLGLSETVYGIGAGIFFLGYFLFEVPSNLMLHRVGARIWIGRIMISWGIVSAMFMFTNSAATFYALRFLLGIAEAGFYPGIILYLTYWYPRYRRVQMVTLFMTAIPVSGIFGGPLSGWIMSSLDGVNQWAGWQWLFLIEAIPAVIIGVVVIVYLDNSIRGAKWLTEEEKAILERAVAEDQKTIVPHGSTLAVFRDPRVWLMCALYFGIVMGSYGLTFWLPTLLQSAGVKGTLRVGMLTAVPYLAAVVAMVLFARSSDRRRERRWHLAVTLFVAAAGLIMSALAGTHTGIAILTLTIAATGLMSSSPIFWGMPTAFLTGSAAAAGIGTINSVGNLAGFASPYMVGWLKDATHNTAMGMYALAAIQILTAFIALAVPKSLVQR
jgi:D-galactonate transporter